MNRPPFTRQSAMSKRIFVRALALVSLTFGASAAAQMAIYDLPEKLVDANGVDLGAGRLIISFPTIGFGDQVRLKLDYFARYPEPFEPNGLPSAFRGFDFLSQYGTGGGGEDMEGGTTPFGAYLYYKLAAWETVMPDGRAYSKPAGGRFMTELRSASWQTPGRQTIGIVDEEGNLWEVGPTVQNVQVSRAIFANGEIWTVKGQVSAYPYGGRLRSIVSNRGYMIQYEYEREEAPTSIAQYAAWKRPVKISGGSLAHVYCDTSGVAVCPGISSVGNSATIAYFANGYEMTHASGFKKRIESPGQYQLIVSTPGTNDQLKAGPGYIACDDHPNLGSVTRNQQTWTYAYEQCVAEERGVSWYLTRTDPQGRTIKLRQLSAYSMPDQYTDELGRESSFAASPTVGYAGFGYTEGNDVGKSLSSRNALAGRYLRGKNGGTISTSASYDPVCSNLITCNRPNTTTDAKGNVTSYTYNPVHGGVLTVTGPAVNGVAPQTRYEYAQKYARLMTASGGHAPAASPIWMLVREKFCRTTQGSVSGCAGGGADEVVTEYDYGPDSGPNNLLLRGVAVTADGQTRRTCFSYDQMGRKISETKSRAGLASCL